MPLARLVSSVLTVACACRTAARTLAWLAMARSNEASATSISILDGTLPPESSATWRTRPSDALDSITVALARATLASVAASAARDFLTIGVPESLLQRFTQAWASLADKQANFAGRRKIEFSDRCSSDYI